MHDPKVSPIPQRQPVERIVGQRVRHAHIAIPRKKGNEARIRLMRHSYSLNKRRIHARGLVAEVESMSLQP